jgi:catechol 2,3-dioxygenase-like lactoylglutathione lyase family enzyme
MLCAMAELLGFHHVGVTVTDLDASAKWYADVLGFEELFREENDDRRACVMRFPGGATGVGLVEHRGNDGTAFDPTRLGLDHLAFSVATQADLEQWAQRLTIAGIEHSGAIDIPPGGILNFKDPDGIALALFWDR